MYELFGLYTHVPFCKRQCPYCDFYIVKEKHPKEQIFYNSLLKELSLRKDLWHHKKKFSSIYFGGGTPSSLTSQFYEKFLGNLNKQGLVENGAEITLEANPEDLSLEKIMNYRDTGINRLSIGIQSFNDNILRFLGRKHRKKDVMSLFSSKQKWPIENISVDLIIGVNGENNYDLEWSLNFLKNNAISHISAYLLTIEQGTPLQKKISAKKIEAPLESLQASSYELVQNTLSKLGYEQYEVSSYAIDGQFSRHNQIYWHKGEYLGIGPSACSMRLGADKNVIREKNLSTLSNFELCKDVTYDLDMLTVDESFLEHVAFSIRNMKEGVNIRDAAKYFGVDMSPILMQAMEKFIKNGLLKESGGIYRLTSKGALFADLVMREILA